VITASVRPGSRGRGTSLVLLTGLALIVGATPLPCSGIEMFTFFGDGSRIGLPSLEVPVEAYPGIPLRADRLRARRAARRMPNADAPRGVAGVPGVATIPVIPETIGPASGLVPPPALERSRQPPLPPEPPETIPAPSAGGMTAPTRRHPS